MHRPCPAPFGFDFQVVGGKPPHSVTIHERGCGRSLIITAVLYWLMSAAGIACNVQAQSDRPGTEKETAGQDSKTKPVTKSTPSRDLAQLADEYLAAREVAHSKLIERMQKEAAAGGGTASLAKREALAAKAGQFVWTPGRGGWPDRFTLGVDGHLHLVNGEPWGHTWSALADDKLVVLSQIGLVDVLVVNPQFSSLKVLFAGATDRPHISWEASGRERADTKPTEALAAFQRDLSAAKAAYRGKLTELVEERSAARDQAGYAAAITLVKQLDRPDTLSQRVEFTQAVSRMEWSTVKQGWPKPFLFAEDGFVRMADGERWGHSWTVPTAGKVVVLSPEGLVDVFTIDLEKKTAKVTFVGMTNRPVLTWDATSLPLPATIRVASRPAESTLATAPKVEPSAPKAEPSAPKAEPSAPKVEPSTPKVDPATVVEFHPFVMPEAVTSFTLTEDGRFLVVSHLGSDQVSVWDAATGAAVKTLRAERPRSLLSRGQQLFVVNDGKGTISEYGISEDWKLVNQFDVGQPKIVHISAARGAAFDGLLLATCQAPGVEGSYRGPSVFAVDTIKDEVKAAARKPLATISCDGKQVLAQQSFNLSPSGGIELFALAEYLRKEYPEPISRGGVSQTPWVFQLHPGQYWIGNGVVFAGTPIGVLRNENLGDIIIPDQAHPVIYTLTKNELTALRLNTGLTKLGTRKVLFPEESAKQFEGIHQTVYRQREYLLDHPIAWTEGETLQLFVLDIRRNVLLTATTKAWGWRGLNTPGTMPPGSFASTTGDLGVPLNCAFGEKLKVQLQADEDASIHLLNGPKGMTIGTNRVLEWTPSEAQIGAHILKIRVDVGEETTFFRPTIEVLRREMPSHPTTDGTQTNVANRIPLDVDQVVFKPGQQHRSLLLLQGDRLRVLGPDGLSVVADVKLPERYQQIAERGDEYIALSKQPARLDVIDKQTQKMKKGLPIEKNGLRVLDVVDFVPHPTERRSYVTIKHDVELPRYRVLVIDEKTGIVDAPEGLIGTWVAIDPAGRYLYAGYKDIYGRSSRFHINRDWRVIETPEYGNIDWLVSYELRGRRLKLRHVESHAGGNGNGIRLSPDGQQITYLSHAGTPMRTGNLAGWNPARLKEPPVAYVTKGRGVTTQLAFHPTLKLAAVPGGNSVVLFDRETGAVVENRLELSENGLGDVTVDDLLFTPDGSALVVQCNAGAEGRYLRTIGLRLSDEEKKLAAGGVRVPPTKATAASAGKKVTLQDLSALSGNTTAPSITTKEISRRCMSAVVQVRSESGAGTGFVLGPRGYILTCAHVVSVDEDVKIVIPPTEGSKTETTLPAAVLLLDDELDLALLSVDVKEDLNPIVLAGDQPVGSGDEVVVIGNPGVGDRILAQTLTTGVVSSPSREIDGQPYIQTSAAVNPGNSGGPMFNMQGQVIGLVVMKASIEGVAFAVPSPVLRSFLQRACEAGKQVESK
jgi:S1-C subfamily serine protease